MSKQSINARRVAIELVFANYTWKDIVKELVYHINRFFSNAGTSYLYHQGTNKVKFDMINRDLDYILRRYLERPGQEISNVFRKEIIDSLIKELI